MPVHSHGCIGTECEVGTQARAPSVIPAWPSTIDCQLQGIKGNAADDISNLDVSSLCYLVAQTIKNLPAMWETCVRSLGWEDPLEKGKAIQSRILAWIILWTL